MIQQVSHRCPSNIALIKYWGKRGNQLPENPSLSFTLSESFTTITMSYELNESQEGIKTDFLFENQPNEKFKTKIDTFLQTQQTQFTWLSKMYLKISSSNSFPHSAGIASSASSMGALALCLCSIERQLNGTLIDEQSYLQKASFVARLASGSACRSVFPYLALWGKTPLVNHSSDDYAVPITDFHSIFKTYQNQILIVSSDEKAVSSRAGHALMQTHPFAKIRYQQAHDNLAKLLPALQQGDIETVGEVMENEALTLHALMMNSNPSVILMQPNTLVLIDRIKKFRLDTKLPVYFTLDAGPNIHLLYPQNIATQIIPWIEMELKMWCENRKIITDFVN
jgi:diphosphomevalonate decarboxylase